MGRGRGRGWWRRRGRGLRRGLGLFDAGDDDGQQALHVAVGQPGHLAAARRPARHGHVLQPQHAHGAFAEDGEHLRLGIDHGHGLDGALVGDQFHRRHAAAVAFLHGILAHVGAQPYAFGGQQNDLATRLAQPGPGDLVARLQLHCQHARRGQPHHPHIVLTKADGLTQPRGQKQVIGALAQHHARQGIAGWHVHHQRRGVGRAQKLGDGDAFAATFTGVEEEAGAGIAVLVRRRQGQHGHDFVVGAQVHLLGEVRAFVFGQLVDILGYGLPGGGEEEEGVARRGGGEGDGSVGGAAGQGATASPGQRLAE